MSRSSAYRIDIKVICFGSGVNLGFQVPEMTQAMKRIQNDAPGPGQELTTQIIELAGELYRQYSTLIVHWVLGYEGA